MTAVAGPLSLEAALRQLMPIGAGVAACEVGGVLVRQLSTGERAFVRTARPVRRAEFAAGRWCAHRALAAIGADVDTIGRGDRRQPIWPTGVSGSISHAGRLAAAVAAHTTPSVIGIGLDVEQADGLAPELWPHVLTPLESARCRASYTPWVSATAVFSAKEAAFKAVFPLWNAEIDFLEAQTELDGGSWQVDIPSLGATVAVRQDVSAAFLVSLAVVASPL